MERAQLLEPADGRRQRHQSAAARVQLLQTSECADVMRKLCDARCSQHPKSVTHGGARHGGGARRGGGEGGAPWSSAFPCTESVRS